MSLTKEFKPTKEMITAADNVFKAMALTEIVRPIVLGYQQSILNDQKYLCSKDHRGDEYTPATDWIKNPDHTYLMSDADFQDYVNRCNIAQDNANLETESSDHCPLLVAEKLVSDAKHVLIEVMEPITKMSYSDVSSTLDIYRKYVELTLQFLAPFVSQPN